MGLKGTTTLINEGWDLFYNNMRIIWKHAQFSFWMNIVSVFVGALGAGGVIAILLYQHSQSTSASAFVIITIFLSSIIGLAGIAGFVSFSMAYSIAIIKSLGDVYQKKEVNTKDKYALILPVLGVVLLAGIIMLGGFILLIIPGIIFWTWFLFSRIARVIDGKKGWSALQYSRSLSKGRFWKVLGRLILINIIIGVLALIISLIPELVSWLGTLSDNTAFTIIADVLGTIVQFASMVVQILCSIFALSVMIVFYFNLKETLDTTHASSSPTVQ